MPWRVQAYSELFYMTEACDNGSTEAVIRDHFIQRLTSSPILRDGCVGVPTCTARNVKTTCGPVGATDRKRRATSQRLGFESLGEEYNEEDWDIPVQRRRQRKGGVTASHYVLVSFEVTLSHLLRDPSLSESQVFQAAHQARDLLTQSLTAQASSGTLNPPHVRADVSSVRRPSLRVQCPPGTLLRPLHLSADRFSCVGCSKGHHLPTTGASGGQQQCQPCPLGHYSPQDSATSCSPCPPGMTTLTTGAWDRSHCQPLV